VLVFNAWAILRGNIKLKPACFNKHAQGVKLTTHLNLLPRPGMVELYLHSTPSSRLSLSTGTIRLFEHAAFIIQNL
jgi:hypothetical protein